MARHDQRDRGRARQRNLAAQLSLQGGDRSERCGGRGSGCAGCRLSAGSGDEERRRGGQMGCARRGRFLSDWRDAAGRVHESHHQPQRWRYREDGRMGSSRRRWKLSGIRHQLRASGLPGALVRAIQALPLPLPRRRVLCRWFARIGPAGAWTLRVPAPHRRRQLDGSRRAIAHAIHPGLRGQSSAGQRLQRSRPHRACLPFRRRPPRRKRGPR